MDHGVQIRYNLLVCSRFASILNAVEASRLINIYDILLLSSEKDAYIFDKTQSIFAVFSSQYFTMTVSSTALIEDDFDLLVPIHHPSQPLDVRHLIQTKASPYLEPDHMLDLARLSSEYRILALALQSFHPIDNYTYAYSTYLEAFNLDIIIDLVRKYSLQLNFTFPPTTVYIIVFRSALYEDVRNSSERRQFLANVDKASHAEANESGGLLKYWFGTPDDTLGRNLATCWWRSRGDAKLGGGGKAHRKGMNEVKSWFKHWQVEEYTLQIFEQARGFSFDKI